MKTKKRRLLILGIGNPLMQDDGIGPCIISKLERMSWPSGVHFIDAGTGGFGLIHCLLEYDSIIIIDAVNFNGKPGNMIKINPNKKAVRGKTSTKFSLHQTSFPEALKIAAALGKNPEITILGIQPKSADCRFGLTPEIKKVFPLLIEKTIKEIQKHKEELWKRKKNRPKHNAR